MILGASGAARAAAMALAGAGVARLVIANRTLERAEALLGDLLAAADADPLLFALTPDDADLPELLAEATLIVNATSIGWHGDESPLPARLIPSSALVFDMIYRPTQLLRDATACGARTLDGAGMLARQAALAFERWTGQSAPLDVMRAALRCITCRMLFAITRVFLPLGCSLLHPARRKKNIARDQWSRSVLQHEQTDVCLRD